MPNNSFEDQLFNPTPDSSQSSPLFVSGFQESEFLEKAGFDQAVDDVFNDLLSAMGKKRGAKIRTGWVDFEDFEFEGDTGERHGKDYNNLGGSYIVKKSSIKAVLKDYFRHSVAQSYYKRTNSAMSIIENGEAAAKKDEIDKLLGKDYYEWEQSKAGGPFSAEYFSNMFKEYKDLKDKLLNSPEGPGMKLETMLSSSSDYDKQMSEIESNSSLTPDERTEQLEKLQSQMEAEKSSNEAKYSTELKNIQSQIKKKFDDFFGQITAKTEQKNSNVPDWFLNFVKKEAAKIEIDPDLEKAQRIVKTDKDKNTKVAELKKTLIETPAQSTIKGIEKIVYDYDYLSHGSGSKLSYIDHFGTNSTSTDSGRMMMMSGGFTDPAVLQNFNEYYGRVAVLNELMFAATAEAGTPVLNSNINNNRTSVTFDSAFDVENQHNRNMGIGKAGHEWYKGGRDKLKFALEKLGEKLSKNLAENNITGVQFDLFDKVAKDAEKFGYGDEHLNDNNSGGGGATLLNRGSTSEFNNFFFTYRRAVTNTSKNIVDKSGIIYVNNINVDLNDSELVAPEGGVSIIFNEPNGIAIGIAKGIRPSGMTTAKHLLWHFRFNAIDRVLFKNSGGIFKMVIDADLKTLGTDFYKFEAFVGMPVYIHFNIRQEKNDNFGIGRVDVPDVTNLYLSNAVVKDDKIHVVFSCVFNTALSSKLYTSNENSTATKTMDPYATIYESNNDLISLKSYADPEQSAKKGQTTELDLSKFMDAKTASTFDKNEKVGYTVLGESIYSNISGFSKTFSMRLKQKPFDATSGGKNFKSISNSIQIEQIPDYQHRSMIVNNTPNDNENFLMQSQIANYKTSVNPLPNSFVSFSLSKNDLNIDYQNPNLEQRDDFDSSLCSSEFGSTMNVYMSNRNDFNTLKNNYYGLFGSKNTKNSQQKILPMQRNTEIKQHPINFYKTNKDSQMGAGATDKMSGNPFKIALNQLFSGKAVSLYEKKLLPGKETEEIFECTSVEFTKIRSDVSNKNTTMFFVPIGGSRKVDYKPENLIDPTSPDLDNNLATDFESDFKDPTADMDNKELENYKSTLVSTFQGSVDVPNLESAKAQPHLVKDMFNIYNPNNKVALKAKKYSVIYGSVSFGYSGMDFYNIDEKFDTK